MIDLHTHSLFSDGALIPAELIRRFEVLGYTAVAITDHVDSSLLDFVVPRMIQIAEEAALAAESGILLEISGRSGHSFTNGHVVKRAEAAGANLVLNSDAHAPRDIMSREMACKVAEGAGLPEGSLDTLYSNSRLLLERIGYPL